MLVLVLVLVVVLVLVLVVVVVVSMLMLGPVAVARAIRMHVLVHVVSGITIHRHFTRAATTSRTHRFLQINCRSC